MMDRRPAALMLLLSSCITLASCAAATAYVAPSGVTEVSMEADRRACVEESGIVRLRDEQIDYEQQCMMARGYTLKP